MAGVVDLNATLWAFNPDLAAAVERDAETWQALKRVAWYYGVTLPSGPEYRSRDWYDSAIRYLNGVVVKAGYWRRSEPRRPTVCPAPWLTRDKYVLLEREAGTTLSELAERLSVSAERVRQIEARASRRNAAMLKRWWLRHIESRPIDMGGARDEWITFTAEDQWREFSNKRSNDASEIETQLGVFGVTRFEVDHAGAEAA